MNTAAFIVIGLNEGDGKPCTSSELKAELTNFVQSEKTNLNKELQVLKQTE